MELKSKVLNATVIVAALGYFVDLYDLVLFGVVRKISLEGIGVIGDAQKMSGDFLLNMQMAGMLIGGLLFGIYGDKKGRVAVLYGSICLYSLANILNGFVDQLPTEEAFMAYAACRLFAGIGLAGELGAGITLVNETMTKESRGWGTTIVVSVGALGAVLAALVSNISGDWHISYFVGGGLGLLLLLLRFSTFESHMFEQTKKSKSTRKGQFLDIFTSKEAWVKYVACIIIGLPIWFAIGILTFLSGEFTKTMKITEPIVAGYAIAATYIGLTTGDFLCGYLSQIWKSRKKPVLLFILAGCVTTIIYLTTTGISAFTFYLLCSSIGFTNGYWVNMVTIASESFGTNIRSTVTTTVPNFIRAAVIPITLLFRQFEFITNSNLYAAGIVGGICSLLALIALRFIPETFGKDLNYSESWKS